MPEWLGGILTGVVIAFAGTAFGVWLQEWRETQKRALRLLARLHVLFEEAKPTPMLVLASMDQERAQRNGLDLWRRWREFRESLLEFQFESPEPVQRAVKEAATHITISIQATRNAINEADDRDAAPGLKKIAEDAYQVASDCVDDLDRAVEGRKLDDTLHAQRRRTP